MSNTFRPWTIDQPLLLPPSVQDFVGEDHLARFILALVLEPLDLGEIEAAYASERGQPPFDPAMMTALLLYGYCQRRLLVAPDRQGDARTGRLHEHCRARSAGFSHRLYFRKRHLKALAGLFGQVLKLCEQAGFVKLGHVALDGTKIKANASKHKAMSYERMEKRAAELEAEVERWLSAAAAADAEEDRASRPRQERRGAAQMGRRQEEARREDPGGEGRIGGRGGKRPRRPRPKRRPRPRSGDKPRAARNRASPPPRHLKSLTPKRRRTSPIPKAAS